jgi:hypothetical protein
MRQIDSGCHNSYGKTFRERVLAEVDHCVQNHGVEERVFLVRRATAFENCVDTAQ